MGFSISASRPSACQGPCLCFARLGGLCFSLPAATAHLRKGLVAVSWAA